MERITQRNLESVVKIINRTTGNPLTPYSKATEGRGANVGNYHLDYAYGGVKLVQMCNESGGIRDTLRCGYTTKRRLYDLMNAYLEGLERN